MYSNINIIAMQQQKMEYLQQRQNVIAHNVANSDTPNFIPSDLTKLDFGAMARSAASSGGVQPVRTNPKHLPMAGGGGKFHTIQEKDSNEITPSGNGVVLEEQMLKMNDTAHQYSVTTSLYRKNMDMFRNALGGGQQ